MTILFYNTKGNNILHDLIAEKISYKSSNGAEKVTFNEILNPTFVICIAFIYIEIWHGDFIIVSIGYQRVSH